MIVTPLADVLQMQDGQLIGAIRATIKNVYARNSGTNSHGDWTLQNIVLKDAAGTEMKCVLKDRDELPKTEKGKEIVIESHFGDRGQSGIKANDNEWPKGSKKITREVYVTPSANITVGGQATESAAPASQPPQATPQAQAPTQPAQRATTPGTGTSAPAAAKNVTGPSHAEELKKLRAFLGSRGNGWALCRLTAEHKAKQLTDKLGHPVPEEAIQAATASLFISAERAGYFDTLPSTDLATFIGQ